MHSFCGTDKSVPYTLDCHGRKRPRNDNGELSIIHCQLSIKKPPRRAVLILHLVPEDDAVAVIQGIAGNLYKVQQGLLETVSRL